MKNKALGLVLTGMLMLAGCARSPVADASLQGGQVATVNLKDGTTFSGAVMKSDQTAITLRSDGGESRTYPMSQVDSVKYAMAEPPVTAATESKPSPSPYSAASMRPDNAASRVPGEPLRTIPAGTTLRVRNSDTISAGTAQAGQTFPGVITADVMGTDGTVAIPKGSDAMLIVRASEAQGKMEGQSELVLDLASVDVGGRHYNLETADLVRKGKQGLGKNRRTAEFVGGGAVLGTIIGAVAGGGKGAAIGAAAGGGAGVATQALTRGKSVRIPAETILSFRLEAQVEIRPAR